MKKIGYLGICTVLALGGYTYGENANAEGVPSKTTRQTTRQMETLLIQRKAENHKEAGGAYYAENRKPAAGRITALNRRLPAITKGIYTLPRSLALRKENSRRLAPGKPPAARTDTAAARTGTTATAEASGDASTNRASYGTDLGAFTVTAYTAGYESTQKKKGEPGYGQTASGAYVKEGRTIAADWAVLPPGTVVKIEGLPGQYVVEDRGGAVNGRHIDLYIADLDRAKDWGVRQLTITIIERADKK